jgi:hypothetical protein
LDLNDVTNTLEVVLNVLDAVIVFDESRHSQVETTKDNLLLDVLDEGLNVRVNLQSVNVADVSIDKPVANAFPCITQDLMV